MNELKPCPCCAGPAEADSRQPYCSLEGRLGNAAAIYCTKCGIQISFCYADARDQSEEQIQEYIREIWNRRPLAPLSVAEAGA